jgi:pyruvate dehydrogenase E2 component (dihydrolipoamide acetyltransferase)
MSSSPAGRGPTSRPTSNGYFGAIVDAPAESSGLKGGSYVEEPNRIQRGIVRRAAEARATVPDLELSADVEMTACLALARDNGHSLTAILTRACALALRAVPRANGAYRDGRFEVFERVNVGVVCETEDAYLIPTVLDADAKSLAELTAELEGLAGRAREGSLSPPELAGGTFTLADLGAHGIPRWAALVNSQQAAMLVAGAVHSVPIVHEGTIVPGEMATLTLGCDHRILYPAEAARWLTHVRSALETGAL